MNRHTDLSALLSIAVRAAEAASTEIMKVYNEGSFVTEYKKDDSPVTIADKCAHEKIAEVLNKYDSYPILSEEGKSIAYSVRKNWTCFWMIDPLDGTKEFIKRSDEFTVNIALIEGHEPILGVVAVPATAELYYGAQGLGAFHKKGETITQLMPQKKDTDLQQPGLRVVASRNHLNAETEEFIQSLNHPVLSNAGSSLKFMLLATGKADVYPRLSPCMEWDTAAAHAILKVIGIHVAEIKNRTELTYNKESLLNPSFICY